MSPPVVKPCVIFNHNSLNNYWMYVHGPLRMNPTFTFVVFQLSRKLLQDIKSIDLDEYNNFSDPSIRLALLLWRHHQVIL